MQSIKHHREIAVVPGIAREHMEVYGAPSNEWTLKRRERDHMPQDDGLSQINPDRSAILEILHGDLEELCRRAEMQLHLVTVLMEEEKQRRKMAQCNDNCGGKSNDSVRLKAALRETIDVLEQSRKSFKSKQLEALRKHLICVLVGANE